MASSRRVRVSRIIQKRKVLRLLPAILVGSNRQQKGVFLLVVNFWHMKPKYWPGAMKSQSGRVQFGQKKEDNLYESNEQNIAKIDA